MLYNTICFNTGTIHEILYKQYCIFECFFKIISFLHTHFYSNWITIVDNSKKLTSIVNSYMPTTSANICRLINNFFIIHVIMCGHILEILSALCKRMCVCIGSFSKVICIMHHNIFRCISFICIIFWNKICINFHAVYTPFLFL